MRGRKQKINWKVLIVCLVIPFIAGFIGSTFNFGRTEGAWYEATRPSITPPGWVFPIVWNILFFLIGLSLYFAWINGNIKQKKNVGIVFGINLVLNALWSYLYFGRQNPLLAFVDIILIWITIVVMIYVSYKIDRKAAWLLVPYFLWVSFASVLNYLSI